MPITVLLAGDKELERQAIRGILETHAEIELVGEAVDFPQATQMSNDLKPQVVIADLHMPDEARVSPIEVATLLNSGASRLLVISIWEDEEANVLADKFGAYTLLEKDDLGRTLVPAILAKAAELRSRSAGNS
jgi:two-component system, NarL family, nitrate/nitrite response regulator NarL